MKKMKIFLMLLPLLLAAGCSLFYKNITKQAPEKAINKQEPFFGGGRDEDETDKWGEYRNENLGFILKFPKPWDGFAVSEGDYPDYSYANLSFVSGHDPLTIFSIYRYSTEEWDKVKGTSSLRLLNQTAENVYVCDGCCDEDMDFTGDGQFDEFQIARCQEAPRILQTFQILK